MDESSSKQPSTAGHEPNAVASRAIWLSGAGLLAVVILAFALTADLWRYLSRSEDALRPVTSVIRTIDDQVNGAPVLDPDQTIDLRKLRAQERQMLNQYAWIDRQARVARIPIERAIDIVSQAGLPTAVGPPAANGSDSHE